MRRLRTSHRRSTGKARSSSIPTVDTEELEYVGFWPRVGAAMIDSLLIVFITLPLLTAVYGREYWVSEAWVHGLRRPHQLGAARRGRGAVLVYRQATPGKMAISARIVDAQTGAKPTTGQLVVRYLGYYVAMIPLFAGIVWVAFDPRKQGWHDKLAGTVVVRPSAAVPRR